MIRLQIHWLTAANAGSLQSGVNMWMIPWSAKSRKMAQKKQITTMSSRMGTMTLFTGSMVDTPRLTDRADARMARKWQSTGQSVSCREKCCTKLEL